jgi:FeS assembly SUF system regulator
MLRMSKLTDYGLVLLTHLAQPGAATVRTAHELATCTHVPLPTVSKILKALSRSGIIASHRGRRGGYSLLRAPGDISVAAVIEALDGPVALTECTASAGSCALEAICVARDRWGPISLAIRRTLQGLPLTALGDGLRLGAELLKLAPLPAAATRVAAGRPELHPFAGPSEVTP